MRARLYEIGQKVETGNIKNGRITAFRKSVWGGLEIQVEQDEPFPYVGVLNPRRKIWYHESWIGNRP